MDIGSLFLYFIAADACERRVKYEISRIWRDHFFRDA